MATQGLITITLDGKVRAKIITGSDGREIPELAAKLRANPTTDLSELMERSKEYFGGPSLCVMTSPDEWLFDEDAPEELPPLYRDKFDVPDFNPRWHHGTAEYTERVELISENDKILPTCEGHGATEVKDHE